MPLSPAPVYPGTSPLTPPGQQPANRRAQRAAVVVSLGLLAGLVLAGQLLLPRLLFIAPGLQAQAAASQPGQGGTTFQGFVFPYDRTSSGGGYDDKASLQNMHSQASIFHMNAVIIPVVADQPDSLDSRISWSGGDSDNVHTLGDDQYTKAIHDAKQAGLVPILELQLRADDNAALEADSSTVIGTSWAEVQSDRDVGGSHGKVRVGAVEKQWFDNYTAFAVHYAQLSAKENLPFFVIGDGLTGMTVDTPYTTAKADPKGRDRTMPGEPPCPPDRGRRDCSWRHVIDAIRQPGYLTLSSHQSQVGANYQGKLIYAAHWEGAENGSLNLPEFENITWWDAVDYIGVDANFPLLKDQGAPSTEILMDAWHGKGAYAAGQGDIVGRLSKVSDTYQRPVVFTSVAYCSVSGAQCSANAGGEENDSDQLRYMQALLLTFGDASWWDGVFWYADYPIPRDKQPFWSLLSNWAGPTLDTSKEAGKWLASYYKPNPIKP